MDADKLKEILRLHGMWLRSEPGGERANLSRANLSRADLYGANLSRADLSGAYLSGADLSGANLSRADLSGAYLYGANLPGAYLYGANLSRAYLSGAYLSGAYLYGANLPGAYLYGANLSRADLSGAYLSGAYLYGANLSGADLSRADLSGAYLSGAYLSGAKNISDIANARTSIVPDTGEFVGWKKCKDGVIVKLLIPAKAKRSNASDRKCRAEKVKVLEVIGAKVGLSMHDNGATEYRKGKIVKCHAWEENRWVECGGGIHFYITRAEAEAH